MSDTTDRTAEREIETVAKLLRALATATDYQKHKHDIILNKAADLLQSRRSPSAEAEKLAEALMEKVAECDECSGSGVHTFWGPQLQAIHEPCPECAKARSALSAFESRKEGA